MKISRRRALLWIVLIAWTGVMFYLSLQTATDSDSVSIGIAERLMRIFPFIQNFYKDPMEFNELVRKTAHFMEFALEGALIGCVLAQVWNRRCAAIIAPLSCAALAVVNELAQMLAEGRSCEVRDMLIDFGGALFGLFVYGVIRTAREKRENNLS